VVSQCVAVCCIVLRRVVTVLSNLVGRTLCCSMWLCVAASDFGAVGCSRSFDAVWCSVLQLAVTVLSNMVGRMF